MSSSNSAGSGSILELLNLNPIHGSSLNQLLHSFSSSSSSASLISSYSSSSSCSSSSALLMSSSASLISSSLSSSSLLSSSASLIQHPHPLHEVSSPFVLHPDSFSLKDQINSLSPHVESSTLDNWSQFVWMKENKEAQRLSQRVFFHLMDLLILCRKVHHGWSPIQITEPLKLRICQNAEHKITILFCQPLQAPLRNKKPAIFRLQFLQSVYQWIKETYPLERHYILVGGPLSPTSRSFLKNHQTPCLEYFYYRDLMAPFISHEMAQCSRPVHLYRFQSEEWKQLLQHLKLFKRSSQEYLYEKLKCIEETDRLAIQYFAKKGDILQMEHLTSFSGQVTDYFQIVLPFVKHK